MALQPMPGVTGPRQPSELDLASLVASRLCHDLISPIGAVANGVELLEMSGVKGPELDLIAESALGASARVRFMRIAFGAADEGQSLDVSQIRSILDAADRGSRVRVEWRSPERCVRADVKLAFLLLQCVETALPKGGPAEVSLGEGGLMIEARGEVSADRGLWSHLIGDARPDPEVAPSVVHFPLAAAMARTASRKVEAEFGDDRIALSA